MQPFSSHMVAIRRPPLSTRRMARLNWPVWLVIYQDITSVMVTRLSINPARRITTLLTCRLSVCTCLLYTSDAADE